MQTKHKTLKIYFLPFKRLKIGADKNVLIVLFGICLSKRFGC